MTSPSNSDVQNLLPVQAYFNLDGSFNTFIGQGVAFYATANPVQSGLTITNSTLNSSPIGGTSPSTGVFTNIATTTGTISTNASSPTDIVNYLTLQSYAAGISWKNPVTAATTANITLSGLQTVDTVSLVAGNTVLVKNQTDNTKNGIYQVNTGAWTYATGSTTWAQYVSALVFVEYGTQAGSAWYCTAQPGGTLGTTAMTWSNFSVASTYTAGTGLTLAGYQFSITPVGTANTYGSATATPVFTTNASGQVTAVTNTTITPALGSITGFGTGVATFLATPTSANLAAAVSDETGSGALVFANGPTLIAPALGTPASGVVTNLTGTASININGSVGATTPTTGAFTVLSTSSTTNTTPVLGFNASNSPLALGATISGSYLQVVMQNKSGTAGASTNWAVSNDLATDSSYYGEFGMNSSVFSASTPADFFSINNGIYFSGHDGDLSIGSGNGFKTYLAWGTTGQSAHVINATGAIGLSTNLGATPATSGTTGFGTSGQVLTSQGSAAAPTWTTPTTGTVTSVSGTAPISVATGTTTPVISISQATTSTNGYLSSTDWNTFNGKAPSVTYTTNYIPYGQGTTTPAQSTNLQFNGTTLTVANDASISGLTVGKGAGSVGTNTVLGASALSANTTGDSNTAIGTQSLNANTTGYANTAIGQLALLSNTTGLVNTASGQSALRFNTTGGSNSAFGKDALYSNTTASNNTAVGYQSQYSNTTGGYNSTLGYQAGYSNTTGAIEAFGYRAGYSNTTGIYNTAIGNQSLYATSTGNNNTALGTQALYSNTTASGNTAVGYQANYSNTTASFNTIVGYQAGYTTTTGQYNTHLGYRAGYTATGSNNTYIGFGTGYSTTTGQGNTFIGNQGSSGSYGSGYYVTTGNNNTIIGSYTGNQGGLDIRTANNYIVLSDGDGNPRGIFDNNGNLTVGRTATLARITAETTNDECIFAINSAGASSATMGSWNNAGTGNNYLHGFYVDAGGSNVGNIDYNRAAGLLRYNVTSDATLKNIIGDSDGQRSLEILNTTRIRNFAWKNDTEQKTQIGVIAQELYETYKGAVSVGGENDKGEYRPWGVDKTAFTFHLIAGWQAHEKLIQELKAEIDELKAIK